MARKNTSNARHALKAPSFWVSFVLSMMFMLFYGLSQPGLRILPSFNILEMIETKTLDIRFHIRGKKQPGNDIVIIAVDEKTDDELGRWQSSGRKWIAELVTILHKADVKVPGYMSAC